jgi:hypothetical protein
MGSLNENWQWLVLPRVDCSFDESTIDVEVLNFAFYRLMCSLKKSRPIYLDAGIVPSFGSCLVPLLEACPVMIRLVDFKCTAR